MHRMNPRRTAGAVAFAAGLLATGGAPAAIADTEPTATASAAANAVAHGQLDTDVRDRDGHLLGVLHGHVNGAGKGLLTFSAAHGKKIADAVVSVRATGGKAGGATLDGRGRGTRLTLRVGRRSSDVEGTGRLDGRRVTLDGVAGEAEPDLKDGMKLLVVGHPRGEGWQALRKQFEAVRYDPGRHARSELLHRRGRMAQFAGIVFGSDVSPSAIGRHNLLRSFYGAGKWIIVTDPTPAAEAALAEVHSYSPGKTASAIAVRGSGPEGDLQRVRPTIVYPARAASERRLLPVQRRRLADNRAKWFRGQLRRFSAANLASARGGASRPGMARAAQSGETHFTPPYGAAAIEIALPLYDQATLVGGANASLMSECGWNQTTNNAWCPDTSYWQAQAGSGSPAQQAYTACKWFLANGYWMIDSRAVKNVTNGQLNASGAYTVTRSALENNGVWATFVRRPGDYCPAPLTQSSITQGDDYFYALYDSDTNQHEIVVSTDATVSISGGAAPAAGGNLQTYVNNGKYPSNGSGSYYQYVHSTNGGASWQLTSEWQPERAWSLSRYQQNLGLSGPHLTNTTFRYLGSSSVPQDVVTYTSKTNGVSVSKSFTMGIFGTDVQGGYTGTETLDSSVTVDVPDWQVTPEVGNDAVTYDWQSVTPSSWLEVSTGPGSWNLNDLNLNDFNPATLTAWQGDPTWGPVSVSSHRTVTSSDHYSVYDGNQGQTQLFVNNDQNYDNGPDSVFPNTRGTTAGAGIDLCDSAVMAPSFKSNCAAENAAS